MAGEMYCSLVASKATDADMISKKMSRDVATRIIWIEDQPAESGKAFHMLMIDVFLPALRP